MHPIYSITLTRLKEFIRRPEAVFWVYFFPILMVLVLGIAFRNQPQEVFPVDVIEGPHAQVMKQHLDESEQIDATIVDLERSRKRLRSGKTTLAISASDPADDRSINYLLDPQRPGAVQVRNLVDDRLQNSFGRTDAFTATQTEFDEPGGTFVDFLVPGLLGIGLMGGGMWGVGFAIVDMRIRKLLKRYMATPMRRSDFLISMLLSRLVFMVPQVILLIVFSYFLFNYRVYGSLFAVMVLVFLGAMEFAAIGLVVGSRAKTLETASGLMNLVMLPMWTLCGAFFSYERFPELFHPLIKWLPLTPIIDSLRGVMMEGQSLLEQWPEMLVMVAWTVIPFTVAMAIFRWRD
jgi:ABC-type multidrug transport system permease subunit